MNIRFKSLLVGLVLLLAMVGLLTNSALAQGYPNKPIRVIVPSTAGGAPDVMARILAKKLTENLGVGVIIDNVVGGALSIGPGVAAKARPDGYTILFASGSVLITSLAHSNLPYKFPEDFIPITQTETYPSLIVSNMSLPAKSMPEFIALAKEKPGKLTYGCPGIGSSAHLRIESLKKEIGMDLLAIQYKGNSLAMIDLLAGRVNLGSHGMLASLPYVKAGRLRALMITGPKRSQMAPDVPTGLEYGIQSSIVGSWEGFLAPAGTPKQIVHKLYTEIRKVLYSPDIKSRLEKDGIDIVGSTPEEFSAFIIDDKKRVSQAIKDANVPIIK
jgi:tripartite-type tricarboxylate transporter receptor subunit TctC